MQTRQAGLLALVALFGVAGAGRVAGTARVAGCQDASPAKLRADVPSEFPRVTRFVWPCEDYRLGLRGGGNFGKKIAPGRGPFSGSYHLAEDVWLPAGTEVRAVAAGVVRYSDFSPSWVDAEGVTHWNLGNAVVIEHRLEAPFEGDEFFCSFAIHLAKDRRVAVGDVVEAGQVLGTIGADRSEENGLYPVHLHFGLHRGPYLQISPTFRRELEETARTVGLVFGDEAPVRGEIEIERTGESSVLVRPRGGGRGVLLSLLTGSTSPGYVPADIAHWCSGYGEERTVEEWWAPSKWLEPRARAGR